MRKKLSYEKKKSRYGYLFISLWLVGFIALFLIPIIQSALYSLGDMQINPGTIDWKWAGLTHYKRALFEDSVFVPQLTEALKNLVIQTPVIIIFSLFIATVINRKFPGVLLVKAVFFLPVVIASGVVINILKGDVYSSMMLSGTKTSMLFEIKSIEAILSDYGINAQIVSFLSGFAQDIFDLSWRCGIQIFIFMTALQSVSPALYEASCIEGATPFENFWKITFPMISPMILVCLIYTLIDNFISPLNPAFKLVQEYSEKIKFPYASALAFINFMLLFIIILLVYWILDRKVFYMGN